MTDEQYWNDEADRLEAMPIDMREAELQKIVRPHRWFVAFTMRERDLERSLPMQVMSDSTKAATEQMRRLFPGPKEDTDALQP